MAQLYYRHNITAIQTPKQMIFVRDKGRMCNNILQYAHVYAWGREHGKRTVSMRFAYKCRYFSICRTPWHNFSVYTAAKYLAKFGLLTVVGFHNPDENTEEKEELMLEKKNVLVEGWYVRYYDLFVKYKQEIISLFAFNKEIKQSAIAKLSAGSTGCDITLGVHIRRGDYKTWMNGQYYFEDDVYIDCIRQFSALHPGKRIAVFVCGNDPTLGKEKYRAALAEMNVSFPAGSPGEDLCLLSECDWLIGAPSTFSLVAAMYRDLPLYWIEEAGRRLTPDSFKHFDYLFRNIK